MCPERRGEERDVYEDDRRRIGVGFGDCWCDSRQWVGVLIVAITVQVRNVFGNNLVYPMDENAIQFSRLTGRKTFTAADLRVVKALGLSVHVAAGKLPWVV